MCAYKIITRGVTLFLASFGVVSASNEPRHNLRRLSEETPSIIRTFYDSYISVLGIERCGFDEKVTCFIDQNCPDRSNIPNGLGFPSERMTAEQAAPPAKERCALSMSLNVSLRELESDILLSVCGTYKTQGMGQLCLQTIRPQSHDSATVTECLEATYNGKPCKCTTCNRGSGVDMDCTVHHENVTTRGCQTYEMMEVNKILPVFDLDRLEINKLDVYQKPQSRVTHTNSITSGSGSGNETDLKKKAIISMARENGNDSTSASLSHPPVRENKYPAGPRWAISPNTTDLSGTWKPIITTHFKQDFDEYLQNCGKSYFFRKLAMAGIGFTRETIYQENGGRELTLLGKNPAGSWKRTLISSGSDFEHSAMCDSNATGTKDNNCWKSIHADIKDPESDIVQVESWWEDNGRVHKSWLRGKPELQGGTFETTRYLDSENPDILFCESKFHAPTSGSSKGKFRSARVVWQFQRCTEE